MTDPAAVVPSKGGVSVKSVGQALNSRHAPPCEGKNHAVAQPGVKAQARTQSAWLLGEPMEEPASSPHCGTGLVPRGMRGKLVET